MLFYTNRRDDSKRARAVQYLAKYYECDYEMVAQPQKLACETFFDILHLLLHALPIARQQECERIFFGWSLENWHQCMKLYDRNVIEAFLSQIRETLNLIQTSYVRHSMVYLRPVELEMPLYRLYDSQVLFAGRDYFVPWHLTTNCTETYTHECGMCDACHERQLAFKAAKMEDTTDYLILHAKKGIEDARRINISDRSIRQ
jgi:7-cyano-7-deazaguanine synthase in queuosine biosynthesis